MIDPRTVFKDRGWRRYRIADTAPHEVYVALDNGAKVAALPVRRTRPDGDWALGEPALKYLETALRGGRIAEAWVVLVDIKWNVLEVATVVEVLTRVRTVSPNDGRLGSFWWINAQFEPRGLYSEADDAKPF
jgi:hypothetical protein